MPFPYEGLPPEDWSSKTEKLLESYPLKKQQIITPILNAWDSIFDSKIGRQGLEIGKDIFPTPQIMASYLHELIALEFSSEYTGEWRGDESSCEKDLVYMPDNAFSTEIKTSSDKNRIYANRSYAQKHLTTSDSKKDKNGYYIAINFEKFDKKNRGKQNPRIRRIRFGWLDHTDWKGQDKPTGQQASLNIISEKKKLITLYDIESSLC